MAGTARRLAAIGGVLFVLSAVIACADVSVEDEVSAGRDIVREVRHLGLTADPALDEIGRRLCAAVQRKDLPWRFWVIEDLKSYNAFAAPGGYVFITRDYFERLNDDEAAFVIGHEMAHVDLRHHERQASRNQRASFGSLLLKILTNGAAGWSAAADIGASAYASHYSRVLEREADFAGYRYAEAAGYDARAAVTALSKLGDEGQLPAWMQNIYATHPVLSSREDRLAALGGEEPQSLPVSPPAASHARDLTGGLRPLEPSVPIAVRLLAPAGGRWENPWRKSFTKHLHGRLAPLGFTIAGDDLMYKPDIGDPVAAARSRGARYLLLVTVHAMSSRETGSATLAGTPTRASADLSASLVDVDSGAEVWQRRFSETREGVDVLPPDPVMLYTDTCVGALADHIAGEIAQGCALAAGAGPFPAE